MDKRKKNLMNLLGLNDDPPVPPAPVAAPPPRLQIPIAPVWDPVKGSEFLITSAEMKALAGTLKFDHGAMKSLMEEKLTPLSKLVDRNFIVDAKKYPTVYITSDIHSDVRKFIQMIQGAGLVDLGSLNDIYMGENIYDPALFDQIEWRGGAGTLLVIVGDLVDGKRPDKIYEKSYINDPKGSFEFLLHAFLYNLKIKALNAESDVRFTIGNHDFETVIIYKQEPPNLYTGFVTDQAKIFFDGYYGRRNALLPFYEISPFYLLSVLGNDNERKIACVHGGLHSGKSPAIKNYTTILENLQIEVSANFLNRKDDKFIADKVMTMFQDKWIAEEQPGPLWTRSYADSISDSHCAEIAKTGYKLVVVGHCPTNIGFSRTEAVMKAGPYAGCEHSPHGPVGDGCVVLDCPHSNGKPQLAFVDVALSYGFRNQEQIIDMKLKNTTANPDGNRMRTVEMLKLTGVDTAEFTIERKKIAVAMAGGRSRSKRTRRRSKKNASRKRGLRGTSRSVRKRSHSRQRR